MTERSWFWGGTSTGDAALAAPYGAPYSDDMFSDIYSMMMTYDRTASGVIASNRAGLTGNLAATVNGNIVSIATGIAMVDGKIYTSDATVNHTASAIDGIYYVVLRKTWLTQQIRQEVVTSITQTDGVTWELEICRFEVYFGSVTNLYDTRRFINGAVPTKVLTPNIIPYSANTYKDYPYLILSDSLSEGFYYSAVLPYDFTEAISLEIIAKTPSSDDSGNVYFSANMSIYGFRGLDESTTPQVVTIGNTYGAASLVTFSGHKITLITTYPSSTPYVDWTDIMELRGGVLYGTVFRLGANAGDTLATPVHIWGVRIIYT